MERELAGMPRTRRRRRSRGWISTLLWLCLTGIAFLAAGRFFEEIALRAPGEVDGIVALVVMCIGGLSIGVWLFLDEQGQHNIRWYLVVAGLVAGTVLGASEGKSGPTGQDPAASGIFRQR